MLALERLLLTAWIGALWAVGYLVVPALFAGLEDRMLAGRLAGTLFTSVSWLGLVCGGLLLFRVMGRNGPRAWRSWVLALMLALVVVGEFIIQPKMAALKAAGLIPGSDSAAHFGSLHAVASSLYLVVSILGALLVGAGLKGAGSSVSEPSGR